MQQVLLITAILERGVQHCRPRILLIIQHTNESNAGLVEPYLMLCGVDKKNRRKSKRQERRKFKVSLRIVTLCDIATKVTEENNSVQLLD